MYAMDDDVGCQLQNHEQKFTIDIREDLYPLIRLKFHSQFTLTHTHAGINALQS